MSTDVFLCRIEALRDGESRGFDPAATGQDSLFVVRRGERLHAWRDACPHYGDTPLAWRRHAYLDATRTHIVCSAHGALFEIDTGRCILGPCLGQSLTPVALQLQPDGEIRLANKDFQETRS